MQGAVRRLLLLSLSILLCQGCAVLGLAGGYSGAAAGLQVERTIAGAISDGSRGPSGEPTAAGFVCYAETGQQYLGETIGSARRSCEHVHGVCGCRPN